MDLHSSISDPPHTTRVLCPSAQLLLMGGIESKEIFSKKSNVLWVPKGLLFNSFGHKRQIKRTYVSSVAWPYLTPSTTIYDTTSEAYEPSKRR